MTNYQIRNFRLPFSKKYPNKSLREISQEEGGLTYLNWIIKETLWINYSKYSQVKEAITQFLQLPKVEQLLEDEEESLQTTLTYSTPHDIGEFTFRQTTFQDVALMEEIDKEIAKVGLRLRIPQSYFFKPIDDSDPNIPY